MKRILFICLLISTNWVASAQYTWKLPNELSAVLQFMDAEVMPPIDGGYRGFRPPDNLTQNCHWAIRSRKDGLEIRYLLSPAQEEQPISNHPELAAHRLAMHICSNEENSIMTTRELTDNEREVLYNADWGKVYILSPKVDFSPYTYCKMVVLYRENSGLAYIFNLFDEPSQNIDNKLYTFRFKNANY
ncbi:MAG TPA: hypothetical protein VJ953_00990 [Saprospiraceae bacterium]|nr:hypothetical protein [Saprospiraceae bacterium]